jgi:glycosyltransferase involved in cell wall biosynthesis
VPAVSVIVPARDAEATLPRTLAGLGHQRVPGDFEIIVVDDRSRDATARIARGAPLPLRLLGGDGSGPAAARNLGAAAARAPALAFLDADCEPADGWLAAGLEALAAADLVQGAVAPPPDATIGPYDRTLVVTRPYGLFETANLFVRADLFARLGGFESWLRPRRGIELGEDVWLGWRARRAGARTAFCDRALVWHAVTPRAAPAYVAERARLRLFPALAARIPELRDGFFYRRWFHSRRSAAFDLAVAGALAARGLRSPLPLAAAAPYARLVVADARLWGRRRAPAIAAAQVAADAVGAAALAWGSLRARSLLL